MSSRRRMTSLDFQTSLVNEEAAEEEFSDVFCVWMQVNWLSFQNEWVITSLSVPSFCRFALNSGEMELMG